MSSYEGLPVIDTGTAPEYFCHGLARVEDFGANARFQLFVPQLVSGAYRRNINLTVIMPLESIGPAIDMTLLTLGSGLIRPVMKYAWSKLAS